jgi:chemotaxis protein methyltransferase CheR
MYFRRPQVMQVTARLRDCLVEGGWLVVNASEASPDLFPGLTPVPYGDAVFFRKDAKTASGPAPSLARAWTVRSAAAKAPLRRTAAPAPAPFPIPGPTPVRAAVRECAPALHDALMARVRTLVDAGAREEALQCLRRAVEANPLSATLQQSAALFALEHGDRAMAREGVRRLLYLDPDSAIGHYLSALIEDAEGRRAPAMRLLHDCRRLAAADGADAELRGAVDQWLERMQ